MAGKPGAEPQALVIALRAFANSDGEDFSAYATPYIENFIAHAVDSGAHEK